jgi:ubiquinone/menaquinone biosynthesis C-methylase UbiE
LIINKLTEYKDNLYNISYWNKIINVDNSFYKEETKYIKQKQAYYKTFKKNTELKKRQRFALENAIGNVLDVDCFDGKLMCFIHKQGIKCSGVDFCDFFLEIARKNFSSIGGNPQLIKKGLFQKLPYPDETFDTIISQETLEHFYFPIIMLNEIQRVLKKGGIFIGSVPLENRIDAVSHILYYTSDGLKNLLKQDFDIELLNTIKDHNSNKFRNLIIWKVKKRK